MIRIPHSAGANHGERRIIVQCDLTPLFSEHHSDEIILNVMHAGNETRVNSRTVAVRQTLLNR